MLVDESSHSVATWFGEHLDLLIEGVVLTITLIVGYVKLGGRVEHNESKLTKLEDKVETIDQTVAAHSADTRRHIDPERDERRWTELREDIKWIKDKLT